MRDGRDAPVNGHPFTRAADDGAPLDLVAVQADDQLVGALAVRPARAGAFGSDDRLVSLLAAWRDEIDAVPIPELVDLDAAVAAVLAGIEEQTLASRRRRAGRLRQLAPLAAAAAIIVATVAGVGLGSQDAVPGDTLWAIQKVVNPERAQSVEAKVAVEEHLGKVRTALETGDTATAQRELQAATTEISSVRGQEGRPQLAQEQEFLTAKLVDTPPGTPADLSTPPKSNPAARSTRSPVPAPAPDPSADPSASVAPVPPSAGPPAPTEPDPRRTVPSQAVAPPPRPAPEVVAPEVTVPPAPPRPEASVTPPEPTVPGKSEGDPDPRVAPAPPSDVQAPPTTADDVTPPSSDPPSADPTSAPTS